MIVPIELENTKNITYDITIDALPQLTFDTKVAIVTNPTVAATILKHCLHILKRHSLK